MNLQDQVIYRCIHAACARPLPRKVNFCPYCGTGQHDGLHNHAHVARPLQAAYHEAPQPAAAAAAPAPAPEPVQLDKPPAPPPVPAPAASAPAAMTVPPAMPPQQRKIGVAAAPPRREPVRLRYWLIVLAGLWLIWLYARPSTRKIDNKIEAAVTATEECRLNDAQSALLELRMTKATPKQLERVQAAIKAGEVTCGKKAQREKAWTDTVAAVDDALAEAEFGRASARLAQFTRRYNEDAETRKLREKIASRKAAATPPAPPADPAPAPYERAERTQGADGATGQKSQSVRNLINEAERALLAGNYRAASDKLETCITMVDEGNRECAAFKVHADRMQASKQRCLASGRAWYEDRCH